MPLLPDAALPSEPPAKSAPHARRQSQHSAIAKSAIMSSYMVASKADGSEQKGAQSTMKNTLLPPLKPLPGRPVGADSKPLNDHRSLINGARKDVTGSGPSSPVSTAPSSPRIRPTTLDIPGLTKSRVSPDGRIASRDIGSKLVIVMVGLPARGKSYITKKIARYLNWLQHDTKIFNVGERRRVAAGTPWRELPSNSFFGRPSSVPRGRTSTRLNTVTRMTEEQGEADPERVAAKILINGEPEPIPDLEPLPPPAAQSDGQGSDGPRTSAEGTSQAGKTGEEESPGKDGQTNQVIEQSAEFFDPKNTRASQMREQVAMATLDELLDYILNQEGSVGIFDATNSTLKRRQAIMRRVRERAGPELGVLFLESVCFDQNLLEANMRLKLSGPDYRGQNPLTALADFRKRVEIYEKNYVPLGEFEERNNMQYIQMIDVGRKIVSHQIRGFLAAQTVYYLVNFNLSPRQIWITRHGESNDNVQDRIGGNSDLSDKGERYGKALARFIAHERKQWVIRQQDKAASTHFPPQPGDTTPPNPEYGTTADGEAAEKSFCVWTSMLKRSIQTAQYFDDEEFDVKQMRMLDELNAGDMDGMTYDEVQKRFPDEWELRQKDKLHYRYPGAGGEGYLDIINRLRAVIVEVERMTDHVLLVCHRSVARVLLAYFLGLSRDAVTNLDVPLGVLYMIEPQPYGVQFKAFKYDPVDDWFHYVPDYQLGKASSEP